MANRNLNYSSYLAPRFWLLWLVLGLGKLIAHLPLRIQYAIGTALGWASYYLMRSRRFITETNIGVCFPELTPVERQRLVKRAFYSNGIGLLEALRSWFSNPKRLAACTTLHGYGHLEAALAKGKGIILLGGHYSTLDIAGSLTTLYFSADVLQRDHSNPLFNTFMTRSRQRLYGEVLGKNDIRGMLKCLKRNRIVWYATDQDYGWNNTVFAPFFGQPCATLVSTMRIAQASGATVLPFSHFRRPNAQGYDIYIHPALEDFPSGDVVQDATRLNGIIEQEVRKYPEQYLWMHRRFKTPVVRNANNVYGQFRQ